VHESYFLLAADIVAGDEAVCQVRGIVALLMKN